MFTKLELAFQILQHVEGMDELLHDQGIRILAGRRQADDRQIECLYAALFLGDDEVLHCKSPGMRGRQCEL